MSGEKIDFVQICTLTILENDIPLKHLSLVMAWRRTQILISTCLLTFLIIKFKNYLTNNCMLTAHCAPEERLSLKSGTISKFHFLGPLDIEVSESNESRVKKVFCTPR